MRPSLLQRSPPNLFPRAFRSLSLNTHLIPPGSQIKRSVSCLGFRFRMTTFSTHLIWPPPSPPNMTPPHDPSISQPITTRQYHNPSPPVNITTSPTPQYDHPSPPNMPPPITRQYHNPSPPVNITTYPNPPV